MRGKDKVFAAAWAACYIGTIFGANWALSTFGLVPVGFGLLAPAGVLFAGAAFTFRDLLQNKAGVAVTVGSIVVGAALSAIVSPALALASGTAFLVSECADLAVYTPLRRRTFLGAVALSNAVGLVLDSVIFLYLASMAVPFITMSLLPGQVVGKAEMTALALLILYPVRNRRAVTA